MWRYYALNQFLNGKSYNSLFPEAKAVVDEAGVADKWKACQELPTLSLTTVEDMYLRFLRTPFYPMALSQHGKVLFMDDIFKYAHEGTLSISECLHWATACLDIIPNSKTTNILDGVFYMTREVYGSEDVNKSMENAFRLRCWGKVEEPSDDYKALVVELMNVISPVGDITMSLKDFQSWFARFEKCEVNPVNLKETVLDVHNLYHSLQLTNTLSWWHDASHQSISIILPRGTGSTLVHAVIPVKEFIAIAGTDLKGASSLFVKGERIVVGGKSK